MGLPGAGKTTAARVVEKLTDAVRLSSDDVRLHLFAKPKFSQAEHDALYEHLNRQTKQLLLEGKSVIYDANLNRYIHRLEKYKIAKNAGVQVILIWTKTPREVARERRIEAAEHHHLVPRSEDPSSMFERIAELIEPPLADEPHITLDGTRITAEYISETLGL